MSNFSGLNGALTSLQAQRSMLEVAGQNIANVNTPGYTRQRAELVSIDSTTMQSRYTNSRVVNGGVRVDGVSRLGDAFLEARLNHETASSGHMAALAGVWTRVEAAMGEPADLTVQQSQTGVNLDEETLTLVAGQRAYEAAARVISTLDEMLDTLINRAGIVGR